MLFDFVFFGFVIPIGIGVGAVHVGRSAKRRWARVVAWTVAGILGAFLLINVYQVAVL